MIYIIKPVGQPGPLKIGFADNPDARLCDIQAHSPLRLEMIALIGKPRIYEALLHWRFAELRLHGEWFAQSIELDRLIARYAITPRRSERGYQTGRARHLISPTEWAWLNDVCPLEPLPAEEVA